MLPNWKELVGKRVLLTEYTSATATEAVVQEVSPSGARVKFRWTNWLDSWVPSDQYESCEVLPDLVEEKEPSEPSPKQATRKRSQLFLSW